MKERIAFVTDIHLDEEFPVSLGAQIPIDLGVDMRNNWIVILNDISSRDITKIIFGGDIGELSSNQWFFESLVQFNVNVILGNHDSFAEVRKYFDKSDDIKRKALFYINEDDYRRFIFLDSSLGEISQNQFNWFKNKLDTKKDIMIFIHHPILPINVEVDKQFALKGRDLIAAELRNSPNNITIFSGHYHFDDKKTEGNIIQYVTPASSYQVEKIPDKINVHRDSFGYRIIELDKNEISTKVILFS